MPSKSVVALGVFVQVLYQCTRMNVVRRALIRPAGIRTLVRPHVLRNLPLRFSSSGSPPNDPSADDELSSNPYSIEPQWSTTTPSPDEVLAAVSTPMESANFLTALRPATTLAEMKCISKKHGAKPSIKHFTVVINNCLKRGDSDEAFEVYRAMKDAGIKPDSTLAVSFFRGSTVDNGTTSVIDQTLEVCRDVMDAYPPKTDNVEGLAPYHYGRLSRMLLYSPDQEKHLPILETLLEDIESVGISTNNKHIAAVKIILEMRKKRLFADALDVYRQHRSYLNEFGFFEVLQEYCRISFVGSLDVPLITQYFSIVNDMRMRGMCISPHIYGLIIKHIGIMASKIKRGQINGQAAMAQERLVSTIRRVHDFLTLDASFSPSVLLLNSLMDAYQRLECFGDAYRLWEMMFLTGRYDQITVTIMLDACGYSDQYLKAKAILKKLARARFRLDLRNWNTWVECLCRLGRFDEALNVVFFQMREQGEEPDVASIIILDKFARRDNLPRNYLSRVEENFPLLWASLPDTIRTS